MSLELLLAFAGFAFFSSITPGPNNAMLLASGVNHGLRRTVPHLAGVTVGLTAMFVLVGLGLGAMFSRLPQLHAILRDLGALYLVWLAWKIASTRPMQQGKASGKPLTFWQAAGFQWINPKAWIIIVGAVTVYVPQDNFGLNLLALALLLAAVSVPSTSIWAGGGSLLRPFLSHPARVRAFNVTMALLLVLSLVPMFEE